MLSIGLVPALLQFIPAIQTMRFLRTCGIALCLGGIVLAQSQLPYLNGGPNSTFAQFDFAQMYLDQQIHDAIHSGQQIIEANDPSSSGTISIRDMGAPRKAVEQFNYATSYLRSQNSKDAIKCLQKAINIYPEFVSAHNVLGLAYLDQRDARAGRPAR